MYNPEYDERGKIFTKVVSKVAVNVIIQTTGQLIHGKIHVKPEERLSDELNLEEKFIAVTNGVIYSLEGQILYEVNFLSLNRSQIIWIFPASELIEPKPE